MSIILKQDNCKVQFFKPQAVSVVITLEAYECFYVFFSQINKMFIIFLPHLDSLQLHDFYEQSKLKALVINKVWIIWPGFHLCTVFFVSRWVFWFTIFISKKSQSIVTSVWGLSTHAQFFPNRNEQHSFFSQRYDYLFVLYLWRNRQPPLARNGLESVDCVAECGMKCLLMIWCCRFLWLKIICDFRRV